MFALSPWWLWGLDWWNPWWCNDIVPVTIIERTEYVTLPEEQQQNNLEERVSTLEDTAGKLISGFEEQQKAADVLLEKVQELQNTLEAA